MNVPATGQFWRVSLGVSGGGTTTVNATLTPQTPGVTMNTAASAYADINVGAVQTNTTPFNFAVDSNFVCGVPIDFDLNATTQRGTFSHDIRVPTGQGPVGSFVLFDNVENGQGGFVDGTTGADGIAHIKVDATKGPFDITAAKVGYVALSVLNQAGPLATNMIVSPADSSALFSSYTVSGQITNKKNAGDTVQADLYAFQTVLTKPADTTYSTKFSYFNTTTNPAMNITALELDAQENIVNAYQAPMTARTKGNMTVDIAFPAQSPAVSIASASTSMSPSARTWSAVPYSKNFWIT